MPEPRPVRWLHLSDLHLGCRGEALWWQMLEDFERSVLEVAGRVGPPDLVLISGDLANRGLKKEYGKVDRFLDALLGWLAAAGVPEPPVATVPGNHDLRRPSAAAVLPYRVFDKYHQGLDDPDVQLLHNELWNKRKVRLIKPLLVDYQTWFDRRIRPALQDRAKVLHLSHFPGDYLAELEFEGAFPLCLVGLNSTWQQYSGADFDRRLLLPVEQFQALLPVKDEGSPLAIFQRLPRAILMMHHPPGWLSSKGRKIFDESIYLPDRFDLCVHGHLHESRTDLSAVSGGKARGYFQAPSLFGLESYGTGREERLFGYAWGELSCEGAVRLWPLRWVRRGDGKGEFVPDETYHSGPAGFWDGIEIRSAGTRAMARAGRNAVQKEDLRPYLEALLSTTDHINISGIARAGSSRGATRYPIERLYTPLWSRGGAEADQPQRSDSPVLDSSLRLSDLLPRFPRLLLKGQPGAGKTTFLRLIACMLARDVLEYECPDGPSWRALYLGMPKAQAPIPVLIRIAELLPILEVGSAALRRDDRHRLVDLLEKMAAGNRYSLGRESWETLLKEGDALLLLDGLDEVADERLRERVFDVFRDVCRAWEKSRIVVTSRPLQTAALREMGFHAVNVEPFGEEEIRLFLRQWVAALYDAETPEVLRGEGEQYREHLLSAIFSVPQIRLLATNPVMLTCLSVVHWNEGRLPEARSRVYRAVILWLLRARSRQRAQHGASDEFAEKSFARLALAMMTAAGGKRTLLDFEDAAVAIDPVVHREHPRLDAESRRQWAKGWLREECLWSGIVEEVAGGRIRFWHLTFQEFLAALQVSWRSDGEDDPDADWWPITCKHLDDAQWRETIELLPGCLLEGGEGRVDKLLNRVLSLRGERPTLAKEAQIAAIAGRFVKTLASFKYKPRPEIAEAYEAALERSQAIFTVTGAAKVPVKTRIEVAEALGRGGDPRLSPDQDNLIEVPGTGGVRLGKYPVTVEEYQRFVNHRGYEERRYWDTAGWKAKEEGEWREPNGWLEQLETPNYPVVGVSWYEAAAYCRWLGEQSGQEVRLPSEEEWLRAAIPKGECPTGKAEVAPSPVGVYPASAGRYGHLDMAANVGEWCFNVSQYSGEARSLVRLAWSDSIWDLNSASLPALNRKAGLGFRVAAL